MKLEHMIVLEKQLRQVLLEYPEEHVDYIKGTLQRNRLLERIEREIDEEEKRKARKKSAGNQTHEHP